MSPAKAIRKHCLWCMGNSIKMVRSCEAEDLCPLWSLRLGRVKGVSPIKTIRAKCHECAGSWQEVLECPGQMVNGSCPLHQYRLGRLPGRTLSAAELEQRRKALQQAGEKAVEAEELTVEGSGEV